MAAALGISAVSGVNAMAGSALSIDMTGNNDEAWANIAMVNDDTVETGVNIRASQSEDAPITGYLYRGGAVRVLYRDAQWTEVSSGDVTGYVKNDYLVYGPEAKGLAEYYGTYGVKASWNDVNVFSGQSGEARIVDTAGDGDTYRLLGRDGSWMTVQAGAGSVAYMPAEEVNVVMVLGGAVSVDGAKEDAGAQAAETFQSLESVPETAGEAVAYPDYAGDAWSDTTSSGSDGAASTENYVQETWQDDSTSADTFTDDGSYNDASWADTSYDDPSYDDTSCDDTSYDDGSGSGSGYTETYDDSASSDYTDTTVYTTQVSTSGSADELAAQAASLYQEYLTAQAAADAAVANGSGEQAIKDTAAAAVAAYGRYITAQNAADAAQWGYAVDTSQTSASSTDTSASYDTGTDTSSSSEESSYTETATASEPETTSSDSPSVQASSSDLDLLAALIYCEAGNQPYEGQVAVGAVVMNRIASGSFPGSISEVIYQGGQFTPAYSGALASALASGAGAGYIGAASDALAGNDPTNGCLYFNNHRGSGLQIGDHWFY